MLRRSTTWLYGIWFCLYYELILLWQMPVAWFTFWKSTWGTRMTPADVAEQERKKGLNKDAQPEVAGQAETVVLSETATAVSLSPETKEEIQATPPAPETKVDVPLVQPATAATTEVQTVCPVANEMAEAKTEVQTAHPAVTETAAATTEVQTAHPAVTETATATTDARKAEVEARQEERRRSFTDNIFNQEAKPYIDPRYAAGMHPQHYGRDISEDLAREQQALIELIRENQKQVSELHRLMEQRIELEKMRIAAYQNTRPEYYREESARKQDALQKNQEEDKP
jgi:hypothetical protein